jgi:ornithine carbamoyltransferase
MSPTLKRLVAFDTMTPRDVAALLANARALAQAAAAGATQPLLRGKNFGLVSEDDDDGEAALFRRAALELGAHVAHVRTSLSAQSTPHEVQHTARMLGRLYDLVECQGMAAALVQQVSDAAGVPVFDGLASPAHPTVRLAEQLGADAAPGDARRFVLQAVLLVSLA